MCAAQLDEIPESDEPAEKKNASSGGNLVPALIAIVLAPALTVGAMYFLINLNKPQETVKQQITEGGQPLNMEPSGEEKILRAQSTHYQSGWAH